MGIFDKLKDAVIKAGESTLRDGDPGSIGPMGEAGDPPTPASMADAASQTPDVAAASFPDHADSKWAVDRSWSSDGYAIVSATPMPDVGYDKVAFAYRCEGDNAHPVGYYVPVDNGGWTILMSSGGMPTTLSES